MPDTDKSPRRGPTGRIIVHSRNTNSQMRDMHETTTPSGTSPNEMVFIRDMQKSPATATRPKIKTIATGSLSVSSDHKNEQPILPQDQK